MLKIGDRVKFLNAVGGGRVTGFVTPRVVNVEDEEGFEVPILITELVKDERREEVPAAKAPASRETLKKEAPKPKKEWLPLFTSPAAKPASSPPAYFLAFVPEVPTMPLSGEIKAWLVNDSRYQLLFHFSLWQEERYGSEKTGRLPAYSRIPLKGFGHEDLSHFPGFGFQLLPYEPSGAALLPAVVSTLKVNPVKMYKESSFAANPYFEKRAMLVEINEKELSGELEKLRRHDFSGRKVAEESGDIAVPLRTKKQPADLREVDLHVAELVESAAGLSPKEILELQLERFRSAMEEALREGTRRVVFIHGVGQGVLRRELRRELESRYRKYEMQDASFREYGYGATLVILRKG